MIVVFYIFQNAYMSLTKNKINISVIIPIYNGGKYLNYSLRSIQKQKMKDIEIIIIDDNSGDDTSKIIQSYMKNDKRIKLIKNKENRRILFSKSLAALNCKGKYIIEIDQDDIFYDKYGFKLLYKQSLKNKLDLLHFQFVSINNTLNIPKINNFKKRIGFIKKQPKLKFSIFNTTICLLWGNLIKSDLYKKVIYYLWPIIINYKIIFQEDFLITFFILIYAEKYGEISNRYYLFFNNSNSASNNHKNNSEYYLSVVFAGIIFYDYYIDSNPKDIQIIINYINFLKEDFYKIKNLYPFLFNYFFGKILSNNELFLKDKSDIMKYFNKSDIDSYLNLTENQSSELNELPLKKEKIYLENVKILELSIIIIFNNHKKIIKLINSIISQNYRLFEIILIYDDKNKENYHLLNDFIKSYRHIKLINNKIKKGMLLSISEGVINSTSKYIMILNQNCFFIGNNSLHHIHEEIEKEKADIFEFNLYKIFNNNFIDLYKCKHFKSLFDLTNIKYNSEFHDIDINNELLTNKIFKTEFLKNIIKKFELSKINEVIDYYSDQIFDFIVKSIPHTFKQITSVNLYIYDFDFDKPKFNHFYSLENAKINESIFYINYIFDKSKDTYKEKEKVLKEFFNVLNIIFNKFRKISKSSSNLLNKFLNCKYLSRDNKTLLKFYYKSLIN